MTTLPTIYQQFIHTSRYARWLDDVERRETFTETVDRYIDFMIGVQCPGVVTPEELDEIRNAILNLEVMPSMRALMTAGPALARDNAAGYNCAHLAIDTPMAFDELMYLLMCGCGVGVSVERQYTGKLQTIADSIHPTGTVIKIYDSKIGWAKGFRELLSMLYVGSEPKIDYSDVRPAGARLMIFGGRASGPEPLRSLFEYAIRLFHKAAGRRLSSLECHDLCCKVADIVVVGGVRRSAIISLSNRSDDRMRDAKTGRWWEDHGERALANNSVAYTERPEMLHFIDEWTALIKSKSGERGIFNRVAATKAAEATGRRKTVDDDGENIDFFINPCGEIILRSCQFCNLSEVVVRSGDTLDDLLRKVRVATIIGTMQSTLTDFRYLRNVWTKNTKEEGLLGVSLTGVMDHPVLKCGKPENTNNKVADWLAVMKQETIGTNAEWAKRLGVNPSASITCVKPSGTVSQLVDTASGIHPRFSEYYIRTVRGDSKDPLTKFLKNVGVPCEPDVTNPDRVEVFSFPIKAPEGCVTKDHLTALQQMEIWLIYKKHWCEHNPSVTIYVGEDEWLEVAAWVWKYFDEICGMTFLPRSEHSYRQAPYQKCTAEEWEAAVAAMPKIDFNKLSEYEHEDNTVGIKTSACTGSNCELVDIGHSVNTSDGPNR